MTINMTATTLFAIVKIILLIIGFRLIPMFVDSFKFTSKYDMGDLFDALGRMFKFIFGFFILKNFLKAFFHINIVGYGLLTIPEQFVNLIEKGLFFGAFLVFVFECQYFLKHGNKSRI